MTPRNLLFLYVQRVRAHLPQELLALLGIAVGVALVFAVLVANTSVSGSAQRLARGIAGDAQLQVRARGGTSFDARLVRAIGRVPGVRAAAPLVELRVTLRPPAVAGADAPPARRRVAVELIGRDRRVSAIGGALRELANEHVRVTGAVALPAKLAGELGVRGGDRVWVEVGGRARRVPVAVVLGREQLGDLAGNPIALAPLRYAQRLADLRGRVTRALVVAAPDRVDAVRAALRRATGNRLDVVDADVDARLLAQASGPNDQGTALFAGISALVGLLLAFNAMLLTVPERRRFIADLRLEGIGDLTVARLLAFDALVLGVAAAAVGLALGDLLSRSAFSAAPGYLSYAFTFGDQRIVSPAAVAVAAGGGIAATLLAALGPLADLVSRRPLDAVYHDGDGRHHRGPLPRRAMAAAGAVLAIAATTLALAVPAAALPALVLIVAAMLLLIPALLSALLRAVDVLARRVRSPVLVVSLGELRATATRATALAATGALAVFASVAVEGAHYDLQRELDRGAVDGSRRADLWIAPAGPQNVLTTTPFAPTAAQRRALAGVDGVARMRVQRSAFLDVGNRRLRVLAPPRRGGDVLPAGQLVTGDAAVANERLRAGGWIALTDAVARERGLTVGDWVALPTPVPRPLRLAATLSNLGWSAGAAVLNADDFRAAWGSRAVTALLVDLEPGAPPARVRGELAAALGADSALAVQTAAERERQVRASIAQGMARLTQIAVLVLVAGALALAAAMSGVVWSRRPRLAALKLSGFSDGAVWRALVLESALVLGIGCSIGALLGLGGQFLITRWLRDATGFPTDYAPAGWLALASFAGVTAVAVAIAALPGWAAARVPAAAGAPHE